MQSSVQNLLQGEMSSKELIDSIFNDLESQIMDKREMSLNLEKVTFISVYFLERLENFVKKAKDLNVEVKIVNVLPSVYKVFQVGRSREILETIL